MAPPLLSPLQLITDTYNTIRADAQADAALWKNTQFDVDRGYQ